MAITVTQLQDYINIRVKQNLNKEITGPVMNYALTQMLLIVDTKQDTLVSGVTLKTINGESLLGSGDLVIGGGGGATNISVGITPVMFGTDGRLFFQSGGKVEQDSLLFWNNINKRFGVGAEPASNVRVDVRSQGALSTDVGFRVRNSANTRNIFEILGNEKTNIYSGTFAKFEFATEGSGVLIFAGSTSSNKMFQLGADYDVVNAYTGSLKLYNHSSVLKTKIKAVGTSYFSDTSSYLAIGSTTAGARLDVHAQGVSSIDYAFRIRNSANTKNLLTVAGNGEIKIIGSLSVGAESLGAGTTNTIALLNGVAPITSPADVVQMFSKDVVANNASLWIKTENLDEIKIYSIGGWGTPTGTLTRTAFDASTVTLSELGERVAALITDFKTGHQLLKA